MTLDFLYFVCSIGNLIDRGEAGGVFWSCSDIKSSPRGASGISREISLTHLTLRILVLALQRYPAPTEGPNMANNIAASMVQVVGGIFLCVVMTIWSFFDREKLLQTADT